VREIRAVTGEVSLLWRERDPYRGEILLLTLDAEDPRAPSTFEMSGPLAERLGTVLAEGVRVRVELRAETVEVVNQETGDTEDAHRPAVVDVVLLPPPPDWGA